MTLTMSRATWPTSRSAVFRSSIAINGSSAFFRWATWPWQTAPTTPAPRYAVFRSPAVSIRRPRMQSPDHGSAPLTREQVRAALGPVDEIVLAEIIEMGATLEELAEAVARTT